MRSMLFMDVWILDVIGLTPGTVRVINFEHQLHGAQSVIGSAALHRRVAGYAAGKCRYFIIPGGIPVVTGDLLPGIALIVVRVRPHDRQSLIAIALCSGEATAEEWAASREIDIKVKPVPPLRG